MPTLQQNLLTSGAVCFGAAWILPGHYPPYVTYQQQILAAIGLIILSGATICATKEKLLALPNTSAIILFYSTIPLLQWAMGQISFVSDSIFSSLYLIGLSVSILVGTTLTRIHGEDWLNYLFGAFLAAAIFSCGAALFQWLQIGGSMFVVDLRPGGRPYANLAQPNHLGTLLALGLMSLWYFHAKAAVSYWTTMAAGSLIVFVTALAQSRTSTIFLILLSIWWLAMRRRASLSFSYKTIAALLCLYAISAASLPRLIDALHLYSGDLTGRLQAGTRLLNWSALIDAAMLKPVFGYGFQQVTIAQQAVALDTVPSFEMIQDAHNVILDCLIWMGAPLTLLLLIFTFIPSARSIFKVRNEVCWIIFSAAGAILLHAMLEYPLSYTFFLFPLGLLVGTAAEMTGSVYSLGMSRRAFKGVILTCTALLSLIAWQCYDLESTTRRVRLSLAGIGEHQSSELFSSSLDIVDAPREYGKFWLTQARPGMSESELNWMRAVVQRNAYPPALMRLAIALGLNGKTSEAQKTLEILCAIHDPAFCDEARHSWSEATTQYAVLGLVQFPSAR